MQRVSNLPGHSLDAESDRFSIFGLAALVFLAGLIISPWIWHGDFLAWLVPYASATLGRYPARVYDVHCDYPALIPYLLTLAEAIRRAIGASSAGPLMVLLVKLPNLITYVLGGVVCLRWLRRPLGKTDARLAGIYYLLCPAMFVNAALWGQYEAPLCLAMLGSLCAALNGAPILAGLFIGLALTIKAQAIVLAPVLGIFLLRAFPLKKVIGSIAAALAIVLLISLPYIVTGRGEGVLQSYTTASGRYPILSANAWNEWVIVDSFDRNVEHMPRDLADNDVRPFIGPITPKRTGLLMFAGYVAFLAIAVWRKPTTDMLLLTSAVSFFAFFMLPTEMHERYLVPAAMFFALIAPRDPAARKLYYVIGATAALNQLLYIFAVPPEHAQLNRAYTALVKTALLLGSIVNLVMFVWATVIVWNYTSNKTPEPPREARQAPPGLLPA